MTTDAVFFLCPCMSPYWYHQRKYFYTNAAYLLAYRKYLRSSMSNPDKRGVFITLQQKPGYSRYYRRWVLCRAIWPWYTVSVTSDQRETRYSYTLKEPLLLLPLSHNVFGDDWQKKRFEDTSHTSISC